MEWESISDIFLMRSTQHDIFPGALRLAAASSAQNLPTQGLVSLAGMTRLQVDQNARILLNWFFPFSLPSVTVRVYCSFKIHVKST